MNKDKLLQWINNEVNHNHDIGRKQAEGMARVFNYIQSEPEETCTYMRWDDDYNTWECNKCGEPWTLLDSGPKENNMNFCPNCGRKLTEKTGE